MALNLNRKKITPVDGAYVYMPNAPEPHNCVVSANQATALHAGAILTIDTSVSNANCPVVKQAADNDPIFGVIPVNGLKDSYVAGDKVNVAVEGSFIYKTASAAITAGARLGFNASTNKVATIATAGKSIVGVANTTAAAANDLVQVKLKFGTLGSDLTDYLTSAEAASTYLTSADAATTYLASADAVTTYQPKLTAGDFVDITDNTITTTYTAGTGIAISDAGAISTSQA